MDADLEQRVRILLDKQEIHDQLMRYCRGADRGDRELIQSVYHPDAVLDHGVFKCRGDEAADMILRDMKTARQAGVHTVGNLLIDVEGDVAYSESYNIVFTATTEEGREYTFLRGSRYLDRWERRDGGPWKIAFRLSVTEIGRFDAVQERGPSGWPELRGPREAAVHTVFGQQSHDDPVYKLRDPAWRASRGA